MPIYNGIEFIHDSVSSVLNQTFEEWELLIGINGHPEQSETFLKAKVFELISDKIRVFDFHFLKGKSNTLNHMLKYCKYNYIALLDVDDIWMANKLQFQSQYINNFAEQNSEDTAHNKSTHKYDVIGTQCRYFGERENVVPFIPLGEDINNFDFLKSNPIINSSVIMKKELAYWDSDYDGVEDYDLWLKLWKLNKRFFNCNKVLVQHRIHSASAFNSKNAEKRVELLQKYQS